MTNKCPNCRAIDFQGCSDGTIRCKNCGTIISQVNTESFNTMATRKVNNLNDNLSSGKKSKLVAILLAFFLGVFGGQYFYFGKYAKGVFCLLFFWTYIPGIWGIIHAIILLAMSDDEFNYKYNKNKS